MKFIESFVLYVKGENPEELAKHVQKRATTALKGQLSCLENDILAKEDEIEMTHNNYKEALYNYGEKEFSTDHYVQKVFETLNDYKKAKNDLEELNDKKNIIKSIIEDLK